jgi:hypothetical protein
MQLNNYDFLSDRTEQTSTRYVTFITPGMHRFDLAILDTNRFYGKKIVIDLQTGRSGILGADDLEEDGVLEQTFRISEEQAAELAQFLTFVVGVATFTD